MWLEARRHNTSVESSGCGFDGKPSRPSVQTMPSVPGIRAFIPISHAHKFYIGKLTFDIVAKEHEDSPVASPDFLGEHYDTKVCQSGDNQRSTRGIKVPDCELSGCDHNIKPETKELGGIHSGGLHQDVAHGRSQTPERPRILDLQDEEMSDESGHKSTAHAYQNGDETEYDSPGSSSPHHAKEDALGDKKIAFSMPLGTSGMNGFVLQEEIQDSPSNQKRKVSPPPVEESQDSLAGTIQVAPQPPSTPGPDLKSSLKSKPSLINQASPQSPAESAEPSNSMRSTRSAAREEPGQLSVKDQGTRVLFASSTSVGDSKTFTKFLNQQGVKKAQSVPDCTVLCVGKGELKKTSKFILAVMLGKEVVIDDWVTDSAKQGKLQSIGQYLARDPEREEEWGINLEAAIERGKQGLKVLQDWTVIFTASAKKEIGKSGFSDLKEIAISSGAKSVSGALPKKGPEEVSPTLIIGTQEDTGSSALDVWKVFTRDIISLSVLRGNLDTDSEEFLIQKKQKGTNKKRKR